MKKQELQAIITLLEDPDIEIFEEVYRSLMDKGITVVPDLEKAWEVTNNSLTQNRLEDIIHKIQLNSVHQGISEWIRSGAKDLLEGAYLIAHYQYPELGFHEITNPIDRIKNDILSQINENLTALEKVRIINYSLFDSHHFVSNTSNYYSPQNSYINQVIFSKKGNPISLGIVYASVAQKLGLPIYGVNLPKNFILAYKDEFQEILNPSSKDDGILFYINPFNRGAILGRKEIDFFLKQQNIVPDDMFYRPCSNIEIIQRLILNLIYSYEKLGYEGKVEDLKGLLKISKINYE